MRAFLMTDLPGLLRGFIRFILIGLKSNVGEISHLGLFRDKWNGVFFVIFFFIPQVSKFFFLFGVKRLDMAVRLG